MNRRSFLARGTAAAVPLAGASRASGAAAKTDSGGQVVATNAGKIRGAMQGKVNAFKGIPYGTSTGGAERFMPPSKPQPWTGVRDALELGPALRQIPSDLIPGSMALQPKGGGGREDCLRVNMRTPSVGEGKRPVLVWFHGGGYSAGSANWAMKHDAVVVTVNHRPKVFGCLYLADLGGEKHARSSNVRATMIFNNECRSVNDPFREEQFARLAARAAQAPA